MGQQASTPQPGKEIQVIGAGLPRTGTASFSAALQILLNGPVYHGGTQSTMGPPEDIQSWIRIIRLWLSNTPEDRATMFPLIADRLDGYVATTDAPGAQFVPELLTLYPDAMVICTTREKTAWAKSMDSVAGLATLWFLRGVLLPLPGMRHFVDYINAMGPQWHRLYGINRHGIALYDRHIEWLKEVVPADRLVFFDVKEGWGPLCKALGKDAPEDIPFPRINESKAIDQTAAYHIQRGLRRWAVAVAALGVTAFWFYEGDRQTQLRASLGSLIVRDRLLMKTEYQ